MTERGWQIGYTGGTFDRASARRLDDAFLAAEVAAGRFRVAAGVARPQSGFLPGRDRPARGVSLRRGGARPVAGRRRGGVARHPARGGGRRSDLRRGRLHLRSRGRRLRRRGVCGDPRPRRALARRRGVPARHRARRLPLAAHPPASAARAGSPTASREAGTPGSA